MAETTTESKPPRNQAAQNCHDDGHAWGMFGYVQKDGSIIDACIRCGQTKEQVSAWATWALKEAT